MKRFSFVMTLFSLLMGVTFLFQNCADFKGAQLTNSAGSGAIPLDVPLFHLNRPLDLDNKNTTGKSRWTVGGDDIFYYESLVGATYRTTLITITGRNSVAYLHVDADTCTGERALNREERETLSGFFGYYIEKTEEKMAKKDREDPLGCSFPRLAVDSKHVYAGNTPAVDYEIYFTSEECTPDGELYVVNQGGADPKIARQEVEAFFNRQIDLICN